MSRYIDRKQLSSLLECSVDVVRNNERRWGLDHCRASFNGRLVKYFRAKAIKILKSLSLLDSDS